jgi:hypothetical protein
VRAKNTNTPDTETHPKKSLRIISLFSVITLTLLTQQQPVLVYMAGGVAGFFDSTNLTHIPWIELR